MSLRHLHGRSRNGAAEDELRGVPPDDLFPMYKPALKMLSVEPVGSYAIRINWSDGHSTGIYSFDHFRKICPCAECKAARE